MATPIPLERYVAIDCEMVMCTGRHELARIAIVDYTGAVVYHSYSFVHPANVINYLTHASGIRPEDLEGAPTYEKVRAEVIPLLADKIVVGHTLFNDLAAIKHRHDYHQMRDTALFYPLRERMGITKEGRFPSLKLLAKEVLGKDIQCGEHCPIEDARTTMALFLSVREAYEQTLASGSEIAGVPNAMAKWFW